ncbi:MAG: fatty acid desaturase [Cyanobium sp.]
MPLIEQARLQWLDTESSIKLRQRSDWKALVFFLAQSLLYVGWLIGAIADYSILLNLVFSLSAGFIIGQLFVIGHDACHQALARHRWVNQLIGRLCFLPSLHSYSLWKLEHNIKHHQHTNIKTIDPSWVPLSKEEFESVSKPRQWLERFYRSVWGAGLYYMLELWMKKVVLPIDPDARRQWLQYLPDSLLVVAAFVLQPVLILALGGILAPSKSWMELLLLAWIIPFLCWNWFMGNVVYLHHTHPQISWFAEDPALGFAERQLQVSAHVILPQPFYSLLYNIMAQGAHHLNPVIPLYSVDQAQQKLEQSHPGRVLTYRWTLSEHLRITQACKLYDYSHHCWMDFNGVPTAYTHSAFLPAS